MERKVQCDPPFMKSYDVSAIFCGERTEIKNVFHSNM